MSHRVTAPAVQVTAGSRVHMVYQGGIVPDGVGPEALERLAAKGLIEPVAEEAPKEATKADLEAEIAKRNEGRDDDKKIAVGSKATKADLEAALAADDEAATAAEQQSQQ